MLYQIWEHLNDAHQPDLLTNLTHLTDPPELPAWLYPLYPPNRQSRWYRQCKQWPTCTLKTCRPDNVKLTYIPDLPTWQYNCDVFLLHEIHVFVLNVSTLSKQGVSKVGGQVVATVKLPEKRPLPNNKQTKKMVCQIILTLHCQIQYLILRLWSRIHKQIAILYIRILSFLKIQLCPFPTFNFVQVFCQGSESARASNLHYNLNFLSTLYAKRNFVMMAMVVEVKLDEKVDKEANK